MKTLLIIISIAFFNVEAKEDALTKEERKSAIELLKETESDFLSTVDGLSDQQLNYKPDESTWSVAECIEHITLSESFIFQNIKNSLGEYEDFKSEFSDDQVIQIITDRSKKGSAPNPIKPSEKFTSVRDALSEFKSDRKKHILFVKKTDENLRSKMNEVPFGKIDAYQYVLLMAGHTRRHTMQIKEVMGHSDFPNT
ncbi:MAG: DinB family protein [Bacteroidota bacterium]